MKGKKLLALIACIAIGFTPVISPSTVAHASVTALQKGGEIFKTFMYSKINTTGGPGAAADWKL